jgi:hypothetical protein
VLRPTQCVGAGIACEPGTTEATCKRCQAMRKACKSRGRGVTVRLPPNKVLRTVAPRVVTAAARSPQQRGVRTARARVIPEVEEVGQPCPSRTVYLNEPPADWESDEMAAAVAKAGRAWIEIGKAKAKAARALKSFGDALEAESRASEAFGEALGSVGAALDKQNA